MAHISVPDENFDFKKLTFLKPVPVIGGNYFIRMRKDGSPLYIQPPKCKTKQGIIKTGKKHYTDLMFTNENESFIQWMENIETQCQNIIYDNRTTWFDGALDKHDIENYFTSPLKVYKSGKFYIARVNITVNPSEQILKIYDENENIIDMESVDDKGEAITILEFQGIRCSARSFQIDIELKQMMMLTPKDIFNKCVLTPFSGETTESFSNLNPKTSKTNYEENAQQYPPDSYGSQNIFKDFPTNNDVTENVKEPNYPKGGRVRDHEVVSTWEPRSGSKEFEGSETALRSQPGSHFVALREPGVPPKDEENDDSVSETIVNDSNTNTNSFLVTEPIIKPENEMEEFEVDLEELPTNETIQIKQRNDVYYEMYRDAKRKAKIARDLALASYLEAKRIKNTYMLEDLKDSDESDLETDDDPQDLDH